MKHEPSGLIIECQQERSQILNKEKALNMLKSKLYQLEVDKVNKEKDERDSTKLKIDFGSQIRNYVLHPYKMIKDVTAVTTKPLYKAAIMFLDFPSLTKYVPIIEVNIQAAPIDKGQSIILRSP